MPPDGMDLDLAAVRAFVAITEDRYFSEAAAGLGISQQAISKRIARLESDLGVRLFLRSRTGAGLTEDGRLFLPHARALVGLADQALAVLRERRRSLRVDVISSRVASIDMVRGFHETAGDIEIDIISSNGFRSARGRILRGILDAAFGRVDRVLEEDLAYVPAYLEPLHLLVGRDHPLANRPHVEIARLSGEAVWMPGNVEGSEWTDFYDHLSAEFGLRIDTSGPNWGLDHYVEEIGRGERIGFVGEKIKVPWHPRTVQMPIVDPIPAFPWSMLYHRQNPHPVLPRFARHIANRFQPFDPRCQWLPPFDRPAFTA
ncbi:LysR family transcriptional regulator [Sinosporangium siamense]|uniref:LysR family transcriptional regulator n=1 Tax=Sinosporangium siamense TaxID=1367973 RepID=UPI0035EA91BA